MGSTVISCLSVRRRFVYSGWRSNQGTGINAAIYLWLLLLVFPATSQDVGYYRETYFKSFVAAGKSGRLVSSNEVYLNTVRHNAGYGIYYNKLQTLDEFHVYVKKAGSSKYREIQPVMDVTGAESDNNYSGVSKVVVYLPEPAEYKITYSLEAEDPMLAGILNPIDENFDSLRYIYKIPSQFRLLYKIDGDTTCIVHSVNKKTEEFLIRPKQRYFDYLLLSHDESFMRPVIANLRVLIVPLESVGEPEVYFSRWYFNLLGDKDKLDEESKSFTDSLCNGLTDTLSIIRAIYSYVNQKINYIGLFDSWNAFIPQPVNEVLFKRFGDCKNMANLLTSMLKYKGVDAHYGITSSITHKVDMDFPCLASGDHAICVVRLDGEWLFLDPTNKLMLDLRPPGYIQNRTVFIPDLSEPGYIKVPLLPPEYNLSRLVVDLECTDSIVQGSFHCVSTNAFRQGLLNMYYSYGKPLFSKVIASQVIGADEYINTKSVTYQVDDTTLTVDGHIRLPGDVLVRLQNGKTALFLDFLSVPDEFQHSNTRFDLMTSFPMKYEMAYHLKFDHEVGLHEVMPVSFDQDGVTYHFNVMKVGPDEILITADYELRYPIYRVKDLQAINECSRIISRTMKHAIELD